MVNNDENNLYESCGALMLEGILKKSMNEKKIPFHNIRSSMTRKGKIQIFISLFFLNDIPYVEGIVRELFHVDENQSVTLASQRPVDLGAYLYSCSGIRGMEELRQWNELLGTGPVIEVNTLFGEAFNASLAYLEKEGTLGKSPEAEKMEKKLRQGASTMEEKLCTFPLRVEKEVQENVSDIDTPEKKNEFPEINEPEPEVAPAKLISAKEVLRYFGDHPEVPRRWSSLALENGLALEVYNLNDFGAVPPKIPDYVLDLLGSAGISDYDALDGFVASSLMSWENLYGAFELARLKGFLEEEDLSIYGLAYALISAVNISRAESGCDV